MNILILLKRFYFMNALVNMARDIVGFFNITIDPEHAAHIIQHLINLIEYISEILV